MLQPILEISDLNFSYASIPTLTDINFTLFENDFAAVIGPNGGGKSTLIKLMMGLLKPQSGTVKLFGKSPEIGRKQVGYLAQFSLIDLEFPIKVLDIVQMNRLSGNPFKQFTTSDRNDAIKALEMVGIGHLSARTLSQLSGGEKQRVFLARVLMNNPKLLILDEPTSGVDFHAEKSFYDLLQELNKKMAILMISHDISAVSTMVKKIACLNKKLIFHNGAELRKEDLEEIYACPVDLIAHGVPHRVLHRHD